MPDMDGISATEAIRAKQPAVQVVILVGAGRSELHAPGDAGGRARFPNQTAHG